MSTRAWIAFVLSLFLFASPVQAGTYASAVTTFNWIDPSGHTRVSATSSPYSFINSAGCATSLPTIDDSITNVIPIGFNFLFGDKVFDSVRINSNGRIHLVNTAIPWDNTTCGFGSPVTQLPIPNAGMNYVMRLYGNDLDPTPRRPGYATVCADGVTAANNPCYVSFAKIGTAPNRRFVVSWKGVPEWVSSGAKGAYDIQIIIQENGEFIYQYGPYVAGPAATAGQVGYQISTANYDVPTTGFPAQNFAIRFFVPHPLVEYLMEQSSWSGTDAVIDTSGSGEHGTPLGGVDTVTGGRVCRGADIPSNANTNNIDAIDSGVNVSTGIGSAGTIAFWYKAKSDWSGGGVHDAQLLDATVLNNEWFFVVRRSNGRLRFVVRDSTGTDRIAETPGIATAANTWRHVAVTWNFNPMITANNNKLTIYVDGVLRRQTAFTSTTTSISPNLGTLYFGDNRSSHTGQNGTGRSADAVIDEVRIYNYELSQQGVASLMNLNAGCLDHYSVTHAGSGTSCQPAPITISAHTSTHDPFVNYNLVTLTTSDNLGDWSLITGHGTLTPGPANSGTATYRFNAESEVILGLLHPVGSVTVDVTDGFASDLENAPIIITSTGCAPDNFNACHDHGTSECKVGSRLHTRIAGAAFSTDVVALDPAGEVDTGFTGKAVVSVIARATPGGVDGQNCFVPDTGGNQILDNAATSFIAGKLAVNGTIPTAWREARIKVACDSTHCPPSGITACSADNFAIRPQLFVISSDANADATGTSATATPVVKAGNNFSLTATAVAGYDGTPQIDNSLVSDHNGAARSVSGSFGPADSSGVAIGTAFVYGEVGYFRFAATGVYDDSFTAVDQPSDCSDDFSNAAIGGKFGCKFGNTSVTSHFGRFIPHHFDTVVSDACAAGGFTYSGQPFPLMVVAENLGGAVTANYSGSFAKTVTLSDANGAVGAYSPATLAAGDFTNGSADLSTTPSVNFAFTNKPSAPATLRVRASDGETTSADGAEGTTPLRSGRLRLFNAYGSVLPLTMRVETQYWSGKSWIKNTDDSCTTTDGSAPQVIFSSPDGVTFNPNAFANGEAILELDRGTAGPATINANVPDWLKSPDGNNPSAKANFGVYGTKESRKTIHIRELY